MSNVDAKRKLKNMETRTEPYANSQDEISLIDLWAVLMRRRGLLGGVFALCLVGAVAVALNKSNKYLYFTSLEIGTVIEGGKRVLIDSPNTVLSKIKEGYIPAVLTGYAKSTSDGNDLGMEVRVPKNSDIVVIESRGKKSEGDIIKKLEAQVVDLVKQDHGRIIDVTKKGILSQLDKLKREYDALKDQEKVLISEQERIKVLSDLVEQQLAEVKLSVDGATANRKKALGTVGDVSRAMTLLMIDNEIDQNRDRMAALDERLHVTLPEKKDKLDKALADNRREQANAQTEIDNVVVTLKNIQETRAIIEPTQSLKPIGTSKSLIVVLGAMVGLMLGVFAAFFAEFLAKARKQLKEQAC